MGDKGAVAVLLHGYFQQEPGDLRAQGAEEILVDVIQNVLSVAGGRLDNILRCCRAAVCQTRKLRAAYISDGGVAHCLQLRHYISGTGAVGGEDVEHIAGAHDEDRHFSAGAGYHIDPDNAVQNYQHPVLFLAGKGEGLPGTAALIQQTGLELLLLLLRQGRPEWEKGDHFFCTLHMLSHLVLCDGYDI